MVFPGPDGGGNRRALVVRAPGTPIPGRRDDGPPATSRWVMTNGIDRVEDATAHRRASRSVRDLPAAERPRERLALRGPGGLSAAELIAIVWGTGGGGRAAGQPAEQALTRHGGAAGPGRAGGQGPPAIPAAGPAEGGRRGAA